MNGCVYNNSRIKIRGAQADSVVLTSLVSVCEVL